MIIEALSFKLALDFFKYLKKYRIAAVKTEPKTQLVLIGQELDHETLRSQLNHCLCLPSTNRGKGFGK